MFLYNGPRRRRFLPWVISLVTILAVLAGLLTTAVAQQAAPAGTYPEVDAARIVILPVDRAQFVVGQLFDLKVEVPSPAGAVQHIEVLVNGQNATRYFGRPGTADLAAAVPSLTYSNVAISRTGEYEIQVRVDTAAGAMMRRVNWEVLRLQAARARARNVILFIGDGLTQSMRTAARILSRGLTEGRYDGWLEMDDMDYVGAVATSGLDSIATDSANSASAYATGHKTAVNAMGVYPDSTPDPNDDPRVETIIELVKRTRGMATGIVSTANITDATPAAMLAHTRRRSEQNFIAEQMLLSGQRPDVIMGGGSRQFIPQSVNGSRRKDSRNLIEEFQDAGYAFVSSRAELKATGAPKQLLGLFHLDNMNVYLDREVLQGPDVLGSFTDQPTLWEMTDTAIQSLSQNRNGFFLMVEAGSIDKQAHPLDWERTIWDTIELDKAVGVAKQFAAQRNDTLIIVVADHAHSMTIIGSYWEGDGKTGRDAVRVYGDARFPTYADKNGDGFPDEIDVERRLAIGWGAHPDYRYDYKVDPIPQSPTIMKDGKAVPNPARDPEGELYTGNLPYSATQGVHTVEDVPLTVSGPGAHYFARTMENTAVFFGIVRALGLDPVREGR